MFSDKTKIHQELKTRFRNESDLTLSMMTRAISDLDISNPAALDVIYEDVIFFTGDWPETEGWGSSDTAAVIRSVKETLISNGYLKASVMSAPADVANRLALANAGGTTKFQTGHTETFIRNQWKSAWTDTKGILRWCVNDAIPFDDMLADFRTLGLIDEDVQLGSNLLRELENDDFWAKQGFLQPREA
jgi:hypothetical protein